MNGRLVATPDTVYVKGNGWDWLWNEKITDHINYLLLLRGLVEEEQEAFSYLHATGGF